MNFRQIRKQINKPESGVFDVNTIEDEMAELVSQEVPRRPLEDYAPPATIQQIGQMTATAVMAQTEAAVTAALQYKEKMQGWANEYQAALADLASSMQYIDDKIARFRANAQAQHDGLQRLAEDIAEFNSKARAHCDEFQAKVDQLKLPG